MTTTEIRRTRNAKRKPVTIDGQWTIAHPTKTALAIQGALVEGAKGSSKPPAQYVPVESPQSLRSKARGRILDLIAHGPIVGLVNGLQSILLDETPLQNPDGTFNFEGVVVQTREGYPDQAYIPGFTAVENTVEVNAEIKFATPIVRSVTNNDADAVIVTVAIQGLTEQKSNGDLKGYVLPYAVDVRQGNGAWTVALVDTIDGKTTTTYQRSSRIPLNGPGPFDIRVRRTNTESSDSKIQDDLYWSIMTEVIDARLNYPDSALVAIDIDAELFGSKMPARYYDMELSIIKVPSNYNPRTREYTGFWDGTFKMAWSDNPAWCYYDLATHPTIGANNQAVDKWSLYRIAQYCDGIVPDGYGGMERRFTCNTLFGSREEAITTLNTLASVWRGMVYWGAESVTAVGDMPGDAVKLVTPANITSDGFEYVGTSLRERHSVAVVMWNDPNDNYKQVPEMYEDPESIQLFGWRETQVTAACCTSRGQARRLAKWILFSERMETEIVSYTASTDHSDLRPGDFIKISDPDRAGVRLHGRIKQTGTRVLTLDKAPANLPNETWFLSCVMPSGVIQQREVLNFNGPVVTLKTDFPETPIKAAVFILSSAAVVTPMYRVMSVIEQEDGVTYQISATEHNPGKYNFVEFDLQLPPTPDSTIPSGPLPGPDHISIKTYKYITGGAEHQALNISWSLVDDVRVTGYILEARDPDDVGYRTIYHGSSLTVDEKDVIDGEWFFRVKATTSTGRTSEWVNLTANVAGLLFPAPPDTVTVETTTFEATVTPRNIYPNQMYEFWRSDVALAENMIESNAKRLAIGTNLVDVGLKPDTVYYYYVRGTNIYGMSRFVGAQGKTKNDFEDILKALDEDIRKPGGLFDEMVNSTLPGIENAQEIAQNALDEAREALAAAGGWIPRMEVVEDGITDLSLVDELQAVKLQALRTTVEGFQALVSTEESTRITEDAALAARIVTLKAETENSLATITDTTLVLADADQTLAQQLNAMTATFTDADNVIKASITDEALLRTTSDAALASRMSLLESELGTDLAARILQEETVRASQTEALAQSITTLSATNANQFASIAQTYSTVAYADTAVARAITTVTVNGKKAVFGISVDGEVAEIGAIADRFYVYNPVGGGYTLAFAVANGQTVIQDGMIRDASIGMAKIRGSLQSDNFIPGVLGWRLSKTGLFENNGDVEGSGRMTQTNQAITVFDTAGNLKVKLGKLS